MENITIPSGIIKGIISSKKNKNNKYEKGKISKIVLDNKEVIQLALYTEKQVFHFNFDDNSIKDELIKLLSNDFNNLELTTNDFTYYYRITSTDIDIVGGGTSSGNEGDDGSNGFDYKGLLNSFLNAGLIIGNIVVATFFILLLFKFNCSKVNISLSYS